MSSCQSCGTTLYPDQRSRCGHCRVRESAPKWQSAGCMTPVECAGRPIAEDVLAIEIVKGPRDYDDSPAFAGGQGRSAFDVECCAMSWAGLACCVVGVLVVVAVFIAAMRGVSLWG